MTSFVDIIFLMIAVVFIATRLYSVFGTRGNDKNVRVIIKSLDKESEGRLAEDIAQIIRESNSGENKAVFDDENCSDQDKLLSKIGGFDKKAFLQSACRVFEMILNAFSMGNIESIKGLVSKKIWDAFNQALNFRKENSLTAEVDFIGFKKSEIKDVKMLKNSVKIVVEFESEQINILRNADGDVIEGDENFVQKITDVWTFERSLNAKNRNWLLVSTKKSA